VLIITLACAILTNLWATREYATFEDRGNSYVWTREEHDPNAGPDVLLNLSVRLACDMFHSNMDPESHRAALLQIARHVSSLRADNRRQGPGALPGAHGFTFKNFGGGMRALWDICSPVPLEGSRGERGTGRREVSSLFCKSFN